MDGSVGLTQPAKPGDAEHQIRQLEGRYIELLEKRVADLESLISKQAEEKLLGAKGSKNSAKDLTSNDRIEQYRNNGANGTNDAKSVNGTGGSRRSSVGSPAGTFAKQSKITFKDIRYNEEGVEETKVVPEKEAAKFEYDVPKNDAPDLIWTRRFGQDKLYTYSEVEVVSKELQHLLRIEFAHDPRLHFSSDDTNKVTLTSPFEPLLHNWARLEELRKADCDSEAWNLPKGEIAKLIKPDFSGSTTNVAERVGKAKEDLTALLEQVRLTPDVKKFLSGLESIQKSRTIDFNSLWILFPPGALVYASPFLNAHQVFVVKECSSKIYTESDSDNSKDDKRVWHLHCWTYDWDGKKFNRVPVLFKFYDFQGERIINTLPCHPLSQRFSGDNAKDEEAAFREKLVERGSLFERYCTKAAGAQMFDYSGKAISHGSGFQRLKNRNNQDSMLESWHTWLHGRRNRRNQASKQAELREFDEERVMVDFDSYIQHAPSVGINAPMGDVVFTYFNDECRCGSCTDNVALRKNQRRDFDGSESDKALGEEQRLLCPPRLLGYHLSTRTWLEMFVEKIIEIKKPESDLQFTKLQLEGEHKNLIRDLVQGHVSGTDKAPLMKDFVAGKGQGLVILLHGPPGVGKTLTAESVAALAGKPLFSVSPSDVGLDPAVVEHNLESLFALAARWRAVLLFDEADVFLESRSSATSDLTRNALVSVLLRVLEYYSGILILTTNRINQFDIAVVSRVNLGIQYEDLTMPQKRRIFAEFVRRVDEEKVVDREGILDWIEEEGAEGTEYFEPLNGRQVRNVLFSAASLGLQKGGKLKLEHIRKMLRTTWKFQNSLQKAMDRARIKSEADYK